MTHPFSVAYRAPNIVDVLMPKQQDVAGYRLKATPDLDGAPTAYTTILTARTGAGYLDPSVHRGKLHTMPGNNHVRAVFDPETFNATASIKDSQQFWMRFAPVNSVGVPGADSDPYLVLTTSQHQGTERVVISGTIPASPTIAGSLVLNLSRRMTQITITNRGGNPLFLAFDENGGETEILVDENRAYWDSAQSQLVLRGSGGTTEFAATFVVVQDSLG